jgi:hypothetical protein
MVSGRAVSVGRVYNEPAAGDDARGLVNRI